MSNESIQIGVWFPLEIIKKLDAIAKSRYLSRSDIVREAVMRMLKEQQNEKQ